MRPDFICEVQSDGLIHPNDVSRIEDILEDGGLCLLPSDSAYILTGKPTILGITQDINAILERKKMPMSLGFDSLKQVDRKIGLSTMSYEFIRRFEYSGLTFVTLPQIKSMCALATHRLYAPKGDGTIGVRLSESKVEAQIVCALDYPLPSTPVRFGKTEICTADDALRIIANRISNLSKHRKIAVIVGSVPFPLRLSTVVKEVKHDGLWCIEIIRKNAISFEKIRETAIECKYEDAIERPEQEN